MAPFCLDLLQGPDFCAIRKLCRFSGDYPSGKGFCCFLSLCHIHGFRGEIISVADIFRAKIVDVEEDCLMIELTGTKSKLEAFLNLLKDYEILELARTGITGLSRGSKDVAFF